MFLYNTVIHGFVLNLKKINNKKKTPKTALPIWFILLGNCPSIYPYCTELTLYQQLSSKYVYLLCSNCIRSELQTGTSAYTCSQKGIPALSFISILNVLAQFINKTMMYTQVASYILFHNITQCLLLVCLIVFESTTIYVDSRAKPDRLCTLSN